MNRVETIALGRIKTTEAMLEGTCRVIGEAQGLVSVVMSREILEQFLLAHEAGLDLDEHLFMVGLDTTGLQARTLAASAILGQNPTWRERLNEEA